MIFEARNITKSFKNRLVLRGISLSFDVGEVVGILGPNGAGKTTLFSILTGIIKADTSNISLGNKDITNLKIHERSKAGIVYLPQDSSIFRGLNVEDNIKAVLQITYSSKEQIESKLNELLDSFSLTHLRKAKAPFLSGGERRKVEIARALATSPSYLMLDEPFSGVDPISVNEIISIIRNLKNLNIGIIITDHNVRETLQVIDRGYIIANGKILTSGTPQEIANDKNARELYLGDDFKLY
ncbi:MAG: LPS export ABC transporter ATP-binding protein [Alphaproteobacteria bacterium]|nr:LPS export ABC transporter ATP-binding protein [Alphaproteobacteria bacterium]